MEDKPAKERDTPRLLDQVRERIRVKHYAFQTEETYSHWIKRYIAFHFIGREACPSDVKSVVSLFPDVAILLTLTMPPFSRTTPVKWLR